MSAAHQSARFITFEGGEGAGKSTQIKRLAARLNARGIPVLLTREPGGSPGAEEIRQLLVTGGTDRWEGQTEALLNFAARSDHLKRTILPALSEGTWVLCDRFSDSTMAYQGYGHGLGRDAVQKLTDLVVGTHMPDLTLVLDLPVEAGLKRALDRGDGEDRYEKMGHDFHERLRQAFLDIAKAEPGRCAVFDAQQSVDRIEEQIWAVTSERLGLKS